MNLAMRAAAGTPKRPLYHRLLGLRYYRPRTLLTLVCFEGSILVAVLASLADMLDWWSVVAIPVAVAAAVKLQDLVLRAALRPARTQQPVRSPGPLDPPAPVGTAALVRPQAPFRAQAPVKARGVARAPGTTPS